MDKAELDTQNRQVIEEFRARRGYAVFASNGAEPTNPDWYHNLRAHPRVTIEVGDQTVDVLARVAGGDERERIWATQKEVNPLFADFERRTARQIPVVVLEAAGDPFAVLAEQLSRACPLSSSVASGTWHNGSANGSSPG